MIEKDNGGPAFPVIGTHEEVLEIGATLRDFFAAKALGGLVSGLLSAGNALTNDDDALLAKRAYEMADAMLECRRPTPEELGHE